MQHHEGGAGHSPAGTGFWRSRTGLALVAFLMIAAFYLLTEHTAHTFGLLPFLLLLGALLLPIFMQGGHDEGHGDHGQGGEGMR